MAYNPNNPNGQAAMANSAPVVIASNQTAVPISDNSGSITVDGSVTVSGTVTANAGTGTQNVSVQNASIPVTDNGGSLTVDGSVSVSNFPATQPVSGTVTVSQATAANLNANVTVQNASIPVTDNGGSLTVDGTVAATQSGTWNITNVSGTVSLPTGASTSAKQPSLGTAGTPSSDVITVQGITSMTALKVDGSAVTQPISGSVSVSNFPATQAVSGTVTANAGTGTMNVSVQNASIPVTDNGGSLTVDGTVNAAQSGTWNVGLNAGSNAIGSITNTSFAVTQATAANLNANVTVQNASIPVTDNAGSLTVDNNGTFAVQASQSGTWTLGANSGVDIGDVTINNGSGVNAVNIQDGGNTITIDGTVDTELPAAAALADGAANPTTPTIGAAGLVYNGATWDRTEGASTLDGNGATTYTGVMAVKQVPKRVNPSNLGTATNSAVTVDVTGSHTVTVSIATTTTGTFIIEGTGDNTNWGNVECFDIFADVWVSGQSITPTAGKVYSILAGGMRQIRIRTNATLGTTVSNFWVLDHSQEFIAGIDTGAAPHNFGYSLFHVDVAPSTQQTTVSLRAPATGKKFAITDLTISTGGTTAGVVTIYDAASATAFSQGTTPAIFRGEFAPSATVRPGVVKSFNVPYVSTTANNNILLTTSAAVTLYIQINGYDI